MATSVENPTPLGGRGSHAAESQWELLACDQQDEDAYLRDLTGVDSLDQASSLRVVVNTSSGSGISHLGSKLMHLIELNLSGSMLESVRYAWHPYMSWDVALFLAVGSGIHGRMAPLGRAGMLRSSKQPSSSVSGTSARGSGHCKFCGWRGVACLASRGWRHCHPSGSSTPHTMTSLTCSPWTAARSSN